MKFVAAFSVFLVLLFLGPKAYSQREAANWYFGNMAGLTFNSGFPVALQDGRLQTVEGSATISDRNGNLLFYTDGSVVYDRQHNIMPNGVGLKGNVSSTQSAIIVPKPANPGKYYIFTVDKPDYFNSPGNPIEGINYSEVDMSLNGGFGDIIASTKNTHLVTYDRGDPLENEYKSSEKISAVAHEDGSSIWVVTHFIDRFFSFKVTSNGVDPNPVISSSPNAVPIVFNEDGVNITAIGYLKISPNGKKLAIAFSSTNLGSPRDLARKTGKVYLYDFDDSTGRVTNEQLLLGASYPYGVEFSPKSTKLYVTNNIFNSVGSVESGELLQFDLESGNIPSSKKQIHSSNNNAGALQLAIDGRIYRAGYPVGNTSFNLLSVIKNPEAMGNGSNYEHNSVNVAPKVVQLGLPPFIQSLFLNNFNFENLCYGDSTHFFITTDEPYTSVKWDFGDGTSSTDPEPYHTYAAAGTYVVSLTRFLNGEAFEPAKKELTIAQTPQILEEFELFQCDFDDDPSDGLTKFNLQEARDAITLGNTNTQLYFYSDRNVAVNDTLHQQTIRNIYRNNVPGEKVFAKVLSFNSECYKISEVTLRTKAGVEIVTEPAKGCDMGDGTAEFNMVAIANEISSTLDLPPDVELSFHQNPQDAQFGVNPLPENFISGPTTVYIQAAGAGICYGSGTVDLEMTSFPNVQSMTTMDICSSKLPMTIGPDAAFADEDQYNFEWSTGQTSREIQITEPGLYQVRIIDEQLGCGRTLEFDIIELPAPQIMDLQVSSNGSTSEITVLTDITEGNLYALDDINGPYQENNVFRNVPGGPHVVYVKNINGCDIEQQEILVFGFPGYFTPNHDGYNENWKPIKIDDPVYKVKGIEIYDRYGKLLKQLDPDGPGWDGTFLGRKMPSDDYWFHAILENGKVIKGHFSLR